LGKKRKKISCVSIFERGGTGAPTGQNKKKEKGGSTTRSKRSGQKKTMAQDTDSGLLEGGKNRDFPTARCVRHQNTKKRKEADGMEVGGRYPNVAKRDPPGKRRYGTSEDLQS